MDTWIEKIDKLAIFLVVYTIIFKVFFTTLSYTLPFVLAFLFALVLKKPTEYLCNRFKLKSSHSSLITTIIFFAIIISLLTWGLTSLTNETIQLGKNIAYYFQKNPIDINSLTHKFDKIYSTLDPNIAKTIETNIYSFLSKLPNIALTATSKIGSWLINFVTSVPYILMIILFTLITTYFFTKDFTTAKNRVKDIIPQNHSTRLSYIFSETKKMITGYVSSYMIIIGLTFIETLVVFLIFRVKYAVTLSILAAIFDILPILGIGAIYVPIVIYCILCKNYFTAVCLIISYVVISIIRQIVEPKIVSSSLGIHPVAVLAAIFIGLKVDGVNGMFFFIFLVVFFNILKKVKVI